MPRVRLLFLLTLCSCRSTGGARQAASGELEAHWIDSARTVALVAPAEASWCARDTLLEILAFRNDSAVGLSLYARDSVRVEGYPVFPAAMFSPFRPQSSAAVRLITPADLRGFESTWGQVEVTEAGASRVSGTFDLHLKRPTAADSLHLTGRFTRVAIRPAAASCGRANKPSIR